MRAAGRESAAGRCWVPESARQAARDDRRVCVHDLLAGGQREPCGSQSAWTPATREGDLARRPPPLLQNGPLAPTLFPVS